MTRWHQAGELLRRRRSFRHRRVNRGDLLAGDPPVAKAASPLLTGLENECDRPRRAPALGSDDRLGWVATLVGSMLALR
jgi:hypothetical protein